MVETLRQTVPILMEHLHLGRSGRVADTRELVIPGPPSMVPYQGFDDRIQGWCSHGATNGDDQIIKN